MKGEPERCASALSRFAVRALTQKRLLGTPITTLPSRNVREGLPGAGKGNPMARFDPISLFGEVYTMSLAELQIENQELREKLHKANARIAALENPPPKPAPIDHPVSIPGFPSAKKLDEGKSHR